MKNKKLQIYLAGSVPKGDKEAKNFRDWRSEYGGILKQFLECEVIQPYHKDLDESDYLAVVGSDANFIKNCDLVVVNAESKLGAGTAMELVIAKRFGKLVVTILPKDTHHRRSNITFHKKLIPDWIHPFVFTFSDFILEDINEFKKIVSKLSKTKVKTISVIDDAIEQFLKL